MKPKIEQYQKINEAIRTFQFVRNKSIRFWMDNRGVKLSELSKLSAVLAKEFEFANKLNSQAREAATERVSYSIQRLYNNCKSGKLGKKGYPQFQKNNRSVEYKQTGWKLSNDRKYIHFIDKCGIGKLKLVGTSAQTRHGASLHYYQVDQIKRVRIVRRSDGYYVQLCIQSELNVDIQPTGKTIGVDVELSTFYTDSNGAKVDNPRHLIKSEKALKRLQKRVIRKQKGSNNRKRAVKKLGRKHQCRDAPWRVCIVSRNSF